MRNHLMWPGDLGDTNVRLMQVQFFIKKIEWGEKKSKETFKLEHNESKLEIRLQHIVEQERLWLPLMLLTV